MVQVDQQPLPLLGLPCADVCLMMRAGGTTHNLSARHTQTVVALHTIAANLVTATVLLLWSHLTLYSRLTLLTTSTCLPA
jgi:hypothetical protein